MVSVPTTGTTDCVGAACIVSGPNAGTADDANAAFPSGCGTACISIVGGLASTPGVSCEMSRPEKHSLADVWGAGVTRGHKCSLVCW